MEFSVFLSRTFKIIKSDTTLLKRIFVFAILLGILQLTIPLGVQVIINRIQQTFLLDSVFVIIGVVFVFLVFQALYLLLRFNLAEYIERRIFSRISLSFANQLGSKDYKYNDRIKFFETLAIQKNVSQFITEGLNLVLSFFFGSLIILFYHPFFAVLVTITALAYLIVVRFYYNSTSFSSIKESKKKYSLATSITSLTKDENELKELIPNQIRDFLKYRNNHFKLLRSQYILILLIFVFSQIMLLGFGSYLVINGELTIGQLVASELIFSVVLITFSKSIKYIEAFYDIFANIEKISFLEKFEDFKDKTLVPKKSTIIYNISLSVLIIMPFLLLLLPWRQTSEANGRLTTLNPEQRVQDISSFVDGRVLRWFVKEGQIVKKDDPIVELVDNDPDYVERLREDRDATFKKYQALKQAATTALINLKRQKNLFDEGLTSSVKFEKAQIDYHKLLSSEAEAASSLSKKETNLSRQERRIVVAPSDGVIQQFFAGVTSSIVKKGTTLATFVPVSTSNAIEIFVNGNDLPLVYVGRDVLVEFEGFPAFQFSGWPDLGIGLFPGKIIAMDSSVYKNGKFRVLVTPVDDSSWPKESILRRGAKAIAWVQLNEVSLGYELWRQFNGFPPIPDQSKNAKALKKSK